MVCPDCVGNRDFCHDGVNCFRPNYEADDIIAAIYRALALSPDEADKMCSHAAETATEHSIERERHAFLQILDQVDEMWAGSDKS